MGTVAAIHGYGRDDLTAPEDVEATYYRMIAQSFSLLATGTSKASVGFFLLRLVVVRWQIISIWAIMSVMGILSIRKINVLFVLPLRIIQADKSDSQHIPHVARMSTYAVRLRREPQWHLLQHGSSRGDAG